MNPECTVTIECKAVIVGTDVHVLIKNPSKQNYEKQPLAIIRCKDLEQAQRVADRVKGA
jgi:hypothetical protein